MTPLVIRDDPAWECRGPGTRPMPLWLRVWRTDDDQVVAVVTEWAPDGGGWLADASPSVRVRLLAEYGDAVEVIEYHKPDALTREQFVSARLVDGEWRLRLVPKAQVVARLGRQLLEFVDAAREVPPAWDSGPHRETRLPGTATVTAAGRQPPTPRWYAEANRTTADGVARHTVEAART